MKTLLSSRLLGSRAVAAAVLSVSLMGLGAAACDNDPAKDKAHAQVSAPAPQPATVAAAGNVRYAFGPADSKIEFVGAKVTGKHDGSFGIFTGTVTVVDGDVARSSVSAEVDATSLKTDQEKLTGHLKSPDFFDVEKFPKASFQSTSVKAGGERGATHTVTGNLTLHGVTKAITFPATIAMGAGAVRVDAEFAINRKDFGLTYPGKADDLIKDDVLLRLTVRASPAKS